MTLRTLIGLATLLPSLLGAAAEEPLREIASIGSPLSSLDRGAYDCSVIAERTLCQRSGPGIRYCGLVALAMTFEYEKELLRRIRVLFDEAQFAELARRMDAEFGTGEAHDEKLRTGMAGSIVNRIRVWRDAAEVVMLEQFSGRISTSALHIFSSADFDAEMRNRRAARARGMRDL